MAVACLFKVYPIALGLLLAALYPRRFLPRLVVALALGLALPFLFQEPAFVVRQYALWFDYLRADDRSTGNVLFGNTDFQLLFRVWIGPLGTPAYRVIELFAGLGMRFCACWPPLGLVRATAVDKPAGNELCLDDGFRAGNRIGNLHAACPLGGMGRAETSTGNYIAHGGKPGPDRLCITTLGPAQRLGTGVDSALQQVGTTTPGRPAIVGGMIGEGVRLPTLCASKG